MMIHPIFRFGLPIGSAFVACGIHELIILLSSAVAILFYTLDITGIHPIDNEIECVELPLLDEEEMLHPHELNENSTISSVEHLISALLSATAILLLWIGFIFKGSKPCLLAWILLSAMNLVFTIRYFVTSNNLALIESEHEDESHSTAFTAYIWPSIQIIITTGQYLYMSWLGVLYLWESRSEGSIDYEDLKPVGNGLVYLVKFYKEFLQLGLLVLGIVPLLDVLLYISAVSMTSMDDKEIGEVFVFFFAIEAVPYILFILCIKVFAIKWMEYWRAAFLAVCCLWGLVVLTSIALPVLTCSYTYHINYHNVNYYLGLFYVLIYKVFVHRYSLFYVRKYRNPVALEMTDVRIVPSYDTSHESHVPFAHSYDI